MIEISKKYFLHKYILIWNNATFEISQYLGKVLCSKLFKKKKVVLTINLNKNAIKFTKPCKLRFFYVVN